MKDHPIIFSGPMVQALLAGRKTQTRRTLWTRGAKPRLIPLASVCAGDRLYVREALECHPDDLLRYAADRSPVLTNRAPENYVVTCGKMPGMFMPRWASRLSLKVTAVRTELLHTISRADCVAEGHPRAADLAVGEEVHLDAARDWYEDLWISLNGKGWWDANPEVIVLSFEVEQ